MKTCLKILLGLTVFSWLIFAKDPAPSVVPAVNFSARQWNVTNTVTMNNASGCRICTAFLAGTIGRTASHWHYENETPIPATIKWDITTVSAIGEIQYDWDGEHFTNRAEKVISSKTNVFELRSSWVPTTNLPPIKL